VLTGGPCGGKSTLMRELRAADPHAQRWIMVPEAAPLLFQAGLQGRDKSFQRAVVSLQMALEDACAGAADREQILLCHRGTLDALAYWLRNGWDEEEFYAYTHTRREELFARYESVLHLQTAAIGAETEYRRWPDAHRPETPAQAVEIDHLCARVWGAHPGYVPITNTGRNWPQKAREIYDVLTDWVGPGRAVG